MAVELALEGWDGVHRQGQDFVDRFSSLAQGLSCMIQSHLGSLGSSAQSSGNPQIPSSDAQKRGNQCVPPFPWPWSDKHESRVQARSYRVQFNNKRNYPPVDHGVVEAECSSTSAAYEFGQRIGQAGADLGACIRDTVRHISQRFSWPFLEVLSLQSSVQPVQRRSSSGSADYQGDDIERSVEHQPGTPDIKSRIWIEEGWKGSKNSRHRTEECVSLSSNDPNQVQDVPNEELFALLTKSYGQFRKQGSVSVTTTFDSRTQDFESSVVARGDLWRAEASHGSNISANGSSPLFLLQIGPILFVRDTTLLLPVHLSKQHLLWYGFDRKNGLHSLCPAVWSKHRRWLLMSMICLNPLTCSFMDFQFPNGQFTYVAGEGLTTNAFFSAFGGLLQAQSRQPGDTSLSFSRKTKWGTCITPSVQLPEKSLSFGVVQPFAWQRSGLMVRPTVQLSVTPTFGGRNMGWRAEVIHSPREKLSWSIGCALTIQPSAFASISLGRSKRNGSHSGSSGVVFQVETPLENISRVAFSIQLNGGVEF